MTMEPQLIEPQDTMWPALIGHLEITKMDRWALSPDCRALPNVKYLALQNGLKVLGHISLQLQALECPATPWTGGNPIPLMDPDGNTLMETFVRTFAVDPVERRKGYGRCLQMAALELTKELGCVQMRSWSSADHPANYGLKIGLGFAAHPSTYELHDGRKISGAYFVKRV